MAPFLGESCCCCRHTWGGGRDTADGKQGGNEEQMCRCLEHPRCYRSAKCYYHGQETGCENPPYSTSPRSAPSPGSGADSPHQPQENRSQPGGSFGCSCARTLWSEGLCGKERSTEKPRLNRRAGSSPHVAKKALNLVTV